MDDAPNIAVFCDFENVALGVRDAELEPLDIGLIIERLLDKGKIVVKKAYADWERYRPTKRAMHEAAFELIEIPHVSYSGKNSADIRMVVDALDLCYTKSHVDIFVIVSGDSDFSPLVSKLRENNKTVIGIGVKRSSSDLLVENCDEFIYYDDLVKRKDSGKVAARGKAKSAHAKDKDLRETREPDTRTPPPPKTIPPAKPVPMEKKPAAALKPVEAAEPKQQPVATAKRPPENGTEETKEETATKEEALALLLDTVEALFQERDDNLWGSMVKQTIKRKRPNFSETLFGYRTFNQLLEDASRLGLLEIEKDKKSGGYLINAFGPNA